MTGKADHKRIPELDGFRVLLVFIVSWYHIWQQSWLTPAINLPALNIHISLDFLVRAGYVPVDGTILLSGFLLFLPYAQSMLHGTPMPSVRGFYRRRVMRIMPSYFFVTLLMLFAIAIPQHQYHSVGEAARDLITHFTFTFPFDKTVYYATKLGGASWTIAIEMQMYLLFPWIARLARKAPAGTVLGMAALAAYVRIIFITSFTDYSMVVNQLVSFLDVYAIGMTCSLLYVWVSDRWEAAKHKLLREAGATVVCLLGIWAFLALLRVQAASPGYDGIQRNQMLLRPLFALALGGVMVSLPFCVLPLRFLFGNPVMKWLAAISMNYYLLHQTVAVQLKYWHIPASVSETPNYAGEASWQYPYTWLCFGISLVLATLVTLLVEKPAAFGLKKLFTRIDARRAARRKTVAENE